MTTQDLIERRNLQIYERFTKDNMTVAELAAKHSLTPYYIKVILREQRDADNRRFDMRLRNR